MLRPTTRKLQTWIPPLPMDFMLLISSMLWCPGLSWCTSRNVSKSENHSVPRTELVGDSDRYVKAGSTVVLRCIIRGAIEPPSYIIWYHGSQQLLPDNKQGFRIQMGKDVGPNAVGAATALTADGESSERQTIVIAVWMESSFFIFIREEFLFLINFWYAIFRLDLFSSIRLKNGTLVIIRAAHRTVHRRQLHCMLSAVSTTLFDLHFKQFYKFIKKFWKIF